MSLRLPQESHSHGIPVITAASAEFSYNDKYVIHYDFKALDEETAIKKLHALIHDLQSVGLHTEVRLGYEQSLLVFVKAPKTLLGNAVHKSRVRDWLYGITPTRPPGSNTTIVDAEFEAEDLLALYHLIHWPKDLGGADITPGIGLGENIKSIFPIHNPATNQALLRHLSRKFLLRLEDLDMIRNLFGPKVAFYFAFTQTYILSLIFPSITGVLAWIFLPRYSLTYAITVTLWCTVFLEYWKIQELDLSIRWKTNGVGSLKVTRRKFRYEKVIVDATGRKLHYFPKWKQICRQMIQIPFMLVAFITLGVLITIVFVIEVMISEAYEGPYKWYLEYLPTVLLAVAIPYIAQSLEHIAGILTDFENHRTEDSHEMSRTQKVFVLNFITNYLPTFLTAFVYVPFGDAFVPHLETLLDQLLNDTKFSGITFASNPDRLRNQVIALTLTGQIQHFGEEFLFPFVTQTARRWYREYQTTYTHGRSASVPELGKDHPEDATFLAAARNQSTLAPYNVQEDISQMVIQFGHLALFSPVWPPVPIGFLLNNWFELRSDFLKICIEHQRPAPTRTDGIGPWIHSLAFLNWLGSLSTAAVVHLFAADWAGFGYPRGTADGTYVWWTLPITIFVSEHVFLVLRALVQFTLQRIGSEQIRQQKKDEYARRKKQLDELEANNMSLLSVEQRRVQRKKSLVMNNEPFFGRQVDEGKSVEVGIGLIKALKMKGKNRKLD